MQVAQYVTEQLRMWGVKHIYGVAGDAILPWLDVIGKQKDIRYIACRHESAAAMMAAAEAKWTGRPAVCTATSGPGTLNLLNGLADAYADHAPVLAITGQVETHKLGGPYKQYVPQEDLLRPLCLYSTTVAHPDRQRASPRIRNSRQSKRCRTSRHLQGYFFTHDGMAVSRDLAATANWRGSGPGRGGACGRAAASIEKTGHSDGDGKP